MKWTPIVAIVCITGLLAFAISQHIDGTLLATGFAIIGGLGGFGAKIIRDRMKGGK